MRPRLPAPGPLARPRGVLLTVCLISLATIWLCRLPKMCLSGEGSISHTVTHLTPPAHPPIDLSKADSPFISWPLARVCAESTAWAPGVVFVCDNNSGGIGNIRNYILTCVRYAIDAGASGLVLPQISTRSEKDLSNLMLGQRDFSYFFDEAHFRRSLHSACPQFTLYNTTADIPHAPDPFKAEMITPRNFGLRGGCDKRELNKHTGVFDKAFRKHVEQSAVDFSLPAPSLEHPRIIRFTWGVQWDWPVFRDGPEFASSYGGLLRFYPDILGLGQRAAGYMREYAMQNGASRKFAGLHLRTENDALSRWPKFDEQSGAYLERAGAMGFKAAYLATGNQTEAAKLTRAAKEKHGMAVVTKHELLKSHPADLEALKALTWDQQGLVDFVVLLECEYFFGVSPSSFSMTVAGKRHLKTEGLYTRPWRIGGDGDGRSWLAGKYEHYWEDWLFMFDSLWP
ncbi:hypothetical protein C8A05DRAFT_34600 [Staphylotrichum tortipilum]|uniref:Alternative oxidase n=1 Tax=Staphylotrichum tortipilum TaxID=2831512 RepID=A0AAN6RTA0_9PEZI|nr:hypothetical protein C8A05DRAFT_34600 [Staphylotrichum longicolle]